MGWGGVGWGGVGVAVVSFKCNPIAQAFMSSATFERVSDIEVKGSPHRSGS